MTSIIIAFAVLHGCFCVGWHQSGVQTLRAFPRLIIKFSARAFFQAFRFIFNACSQLLLQAEKSEFQGTLFSISADSLASFPALTVCGTRIANSFTKLLYVACGCCLCRVVPTIVGSLLAGESP